MDTDTVVPSKEEDVSGVGVSLAIGLNF